MIRKFLFKPPSRDSSYGLGMIVGTLLVTMACLGLFGDGLLMLLMIFLGLQQIMIASSQLLSPTPKISGWMRVMSLIFGISVVTVAYLILAT